MIALEQKTTGARYCLSEPMGNPFDELNALFDRAAPESAVEWKWRIDRETRFQMDLIAMRDPTVTLRVLKIDRGYLEPSSFRHIEIEVQD